MKMNYKITFLRRLTSSLGTGKSLPLGHWYGLGKSLLLLQHGIVSLLGHQNGSFSLLGHQNGSFSLLGHQNGSFSLQGRQGSVSLLGHKHESVSLLGHQHGSWSLLRHQHGSGSLLGHHHGSGILLGHQHGSGSLLKHQSGSLPGHHHGSGSLLGHQHVIKSGVFCDIIAEVGFFRDINMEVRVCGGIGAFWELGQVSLFFNLFLILFLTLFLFYLLFGILEWDWGQGSEGLGKEKHLLYRPEPQLHGFIGLHKFLDQTHVLCVMLTSLPTRYSCK